MTVPCCWIAPETCGRYTGGSIRTGIGLMSIRACTGRVPSWPRCLLISARSPRHGRRRAGNAGDMQPAGRRSSSDFYGLRLKPELLTVLRHAGIDLLAYDGALCSEIASPLAEAALRIEGDPGLRALFPLRRRL